jgi:hypothetical protein
MFLDTWVLTRATRCNIPEDGFLVVYELLCNRKLSIYVVQKDIYSILRKLFYNGSRRRSNREIQHKKTRLNMGKHLEICNKLDLLHYTFTQRQMHSN